MEKAEFDISNRKTVFVNLCPDKMLIKQHNEYTSWLTGRSTYVESSGFYLSIEFVLVFVPERRITNEQDIQYYTCIEQPRCHHLNM